MALRKAGLFLIALTLVFAAIPFSPAAAQGGSRTFPETGKTISGQFLTYWEGHGGLAQQGFPISEEIQETSDTNGEIYTIQYMERAVFEHHPENEAPNDVLLSLLGVFLYKQKYPDGAPNQVPNNEGNSRPFEQTGKRLGGVFRDYWESHGGLAQQGFPISDEFEEVSPLNGQTYRVQYFERAVFELHPENQPPFNVLLSQLGKFRYQDNYAALSTQLSGFENQNTQQFPLKAGLAVFQGVRAAAEGYFYINLFDAAGGQLATIAAGSGPVDQSSAVNIPADGMYWLEVSAENGWTVSAMQPTATYSAPPAAQSWSGKNWYATPLFSLRAGPAAFHAASPNSSEGFRVELLDQNGAFVASIVNAPSPADVSTNVEVPADGVYLIQVEGDGDWSVEVQQ